ncbi:uncharacterized protein LOC118330300 [Morone saxatilis]|uniref:uncharacterized protein LOC118330300 n=1 Tax=Morone saxatilis TaxID=34816 RepID=UPI0015E210E5|nr:uncharacterized protein LOC118330300 [Morone saxatilis]
MYDPVLFPIGSDGRQTKKKEKKKKKNRLSLALDDSFVITQASSAQGKATVKPGTATPCSSDKPQPDHLTQDSKKKTKRKKKVAFDLSPGYIRVKRPKFVSSSPQCPEESVLLVHEAVRESESCSQVTVTGHTHDNDSQCNSEDINSQDLFITQKTFRVSPSEASSGEASDTAVAETPEMFMQQDERHTCVAQIKQHLEGSYKGPQDSLSHEHRRQTNQGVKTQRKEEGLNNAHHNVKKGKLSFQTQMERNANLTEEKNGSCPVHMKPSVLDPYLAEPVVVNSSPEQSMTSTATQTENFFTTELSSYLSFCQRSRGIEDLRPLDLSLPQRARKDLGTSSLPGEIKGDNHKDPILRRSPSSGLKDVEVKREPSGRQACSVSTRGKGKSSLHPQSESEPKSTDTSTSSEDNETPCRTGKLDLTQVRAVQTRLNESFFFKTKGEGLSPRPESPLMKLAQGRDVKSRKGH